MFNIGGGELLVIALIALIVLGPQRLPEAARQVGKVMGDLRRLSSGFQAELQGALDDSDAAADAAPPRDVLGQVAGVDPNPPVTPGAPTANGSNGANGAAGSGPDTVGDPTARPRRRAPLRAAPAEDSAPTDAP